MILALSCSVALTACGGGGASSSANPGFTLGGHLTGLVGDQQVTLKNGSDVLVLAADGAFTFSAQVPAGRSYSVSVSDQPTGGACAVTNGAGSNISANITNVTVTCTPLSYTVGGTLVGLASGQQLTLQNSNAEALVLSANGPFTFPTSMAYGSTYSVTVSVQPNPASQQYCGVLNGSGTLSTAVTNVAVACNTEAVLYNFTSAASANGQYPNSGLTVDSAGNLYGTTMNGGPADFGVVYKLSPLPGGGYAQSVLYSFPGQPFPDLGTYPTGGVILDSEGNFYGTTMSGGANDYGVVYKLAPSPGGGYTQVVLFAFDGSNVDGGEPVGRLVMDSGGSLYGVTQVSGPGGGSVFKLSPSSGGAYTMSILYGFTGSADGETPEAGLIIDAGGNLYGTTSSSNLYSGADAGAVFKLLPNADGSYSELTLHTFTADADGATPEAGLFVDAAGNLYGTTRFGSANSGAGNGTVFKLSRSPGGSYAESILYSFSGGGDGAQPYGGVIMDSAGNLFGTTSIGGSTNCNNGCGTIFKLSPGPTGYTESLLFLFPAGIGGAAPTTDLIMDAAGNLYGTTSSGQGAGVTGGADAGNVFEILVR